MENRNAMQKSSQNPRHADTPSRRLGVPNALTVLTLTTLLTLGTTACQVLTYSAPNGERFTRSSVGANTSVSCLTVEATTNGLRRVEMRGYKNDTSQALGAVTEAAVRA